MNSYDPNQDQRTQLLKQLAALGGSGTAAPTGAMAAPAPPAPTPAMPPPSLPQSGPNGPGLGGIVSPQQQAAQRALPAMANQPPTGGPPVDQTALLAGMHGDPVQRFGPGEGPMPGPAGASAAPPALGAPPPGFDAGKWADPNKHDPKYDVGRLLQGAAGPDGLTSAGVQSQLDAINQLYPGTTFDGKDVLTIPGYGPIDVIQGLGTGHGTTAWQPVGQGGGGGGKSMPTAALQSLVGGGGGLTGGLAGALSGGDVTSQILAEINGLMGGNGSSLTRDALLNKLGVQSPSGGQ